MVHRRRYFLVSHFVFFCSPSPRARSFEIKIRVRGMRQYAENLYTSMYLQYYTLYRRCFSTDRKREKSFHRRCKLFHHSAELCFFYSIFTPTSDSALSVFNIELQIYVHLTYTITYMCIQAYPQLPNSRYYRNSYFIRVIYYWQYAIFICIELENFTRLLHTIISCRCSRYTYSYTRT